MERIQGENSERMIMGKGAEVQTYRTSTPTLSTPTPSTPYYLTSTHTRTWVPVDESGDVIERFDGPPRGFCRGGGGGGGVWGGRRLHREQGRPSGLTPAGVPACPGGPGGRRDDPAALRTAGDGSGVPAPRGARLFFDRGDLLV